MTQSLWVGGGRGLKHFFLTTLYNFHKSDWEGGCSSQPLPLCGPFVVLTLLVHVSLNSCHRVTYQPDFLEVFGKTWKRAKKVRVKISLILINSPQTIARYVDIIDLMSFLEHLLSLVKKTKTKSQIVISS